MKIGNPIWGNVLNQRLAWLEGENMEAFKDGFDGHVPVQITPDHVIVREMLALFPDGVDTRELRSYELGCLIEGMETFLKLTPLLMEDGEIGLEDMAEVKRMMAEVEPMITPLKGELAQMVRDLEKQPVN